MGLFLKKRVEMPDKMILGNTEFIFDRKLGFHVGEWTVWDRKTKILLEFQLFARLFTRLAQAEYADLPIRMLGPAGDTLYRVAGKYRCHLILKCRNDRRMRELTRRVLEQFYTQAPAGVQAIPDLD